MVTTPLFTRTHIAMKAVIKAIKAPILLDRQLQRGSKRDRGPRSTLRATQGTHESAGSRSLRTMLFDSHHNHTVGAKADTLVRRYLLIVFTGCKHWDTRREDPGA